MKHAEEDTFTLMCVGKTMPVFNYELHIPAVTAYNLGLIFGFLTFISSLFSYFR